MASEQKGMRKDMEEMGERVQELGEVVNGVDQLVDDKIHRSYHGPYAGACFQYYPDCRQDIWPERKQTSCTASCLSGRAAFQLGTDGSGV